MTTRHKLIIAGFVFAIAGPLVGQGAANDEVFARDHIVAIMYKVNDYQKKHPWKEVDRNWIRATYYTGVMAFHKATGDEKLLAQAMSWAEKHKWQVGNESSGGNKLTCGQTYLEIHAIKKDPAIIVPLIEWIDSGKPNAPTGAKVWYLEGGRRYADSLYVGPPTLAMLAKATGDKKYLEYMDAFYWDVYNEIFDKEDGLFYRDKRFIGAKNPNGKKIFWSRGNGWVIAGLPRILQYLPQDHPTYPRYLELYKTMVAAIAKRQGEDGLWRPNLGDAGEFPMQETSGTGFFVYALAWGINNGILDRDTYLPVVQKGWAGLVRSVSAEGKVQWGQLVGDRPVAVKQEHSHEYVTGTFLLAGSEVLKLKLKAPKVSETILPPSALCDELSETQHPFATQITAFLKAKPSQVKATGLTRDDYLSVIDGQVKAMRDYQNEDGRIIDPVEKVEKYYATPCYAHAVAALAAGGRCKDQGLLESGMKAMDVAVADMARNKPAGHHGDFYTWPIMLAYELFEKTAPAPRLNRWREALNKIDRRKLYRVGAGGNNWNIVNLSGEFLRISQGMTDDMAYVEACLAAQKKHFTTAGMYNEGGNPLPYDHFPRHYLAGMLVKGYQGEHAAAYRDLLWRGAWMSLFMQSPFGELPTGYRSSHHIWNEAEQAVTFEIYAAQYAQAGRPREAGAFKRAAHLSLQSIKQWIRPDGSGYIVKNRYPIEAKHGYEGYSAHTCYNLLACSMLAQAWQFADDSVAERPAPADVGGFVIPVLTSFHKVFANADGNYVEYDTSGDHKYNPTGLLRVHLKNGNPQLGPSDGCGPYYSGKGVNLSVGPAWRTTEGGWQKLAEISQITPKVEVLEETPHLVRFRVSYPEVIQTIMIDHAGVMIEDAVTAKDIDAMRVYYPMLVFDGERKTEVAMKGNTVKLTLANKSVNFTVLDPETAQLQRSGQELNHRNGIIEPVFAEMAGNRIVYHITAK